MCRREWKLIKRRQISCCAMAVVVLIGSGVVGTVRSQTATPASSKAFLQRVRRPFLREAWARFEGRLWHKSLQGKDEVPVVLNMRFHENGVKAQLVLADTDLYTIVQTFGDGATVPDVNLQLPESPDQVTLRELGLKPADFVFSFLYWDLVRELPPDSYRGQSCRVMELRHPESGRLVKVWFARKYRFPVRVVWLADDPSRERTLEFTEFEKHDDMWFVRAIRFSGDRWKTLVVFDDAVLHPVSDVRPPEDLFRGDVSALDGGPSDAAGCVTP